ncbi:MAG: DUF4249 domain-containing protein [Bacteroidia bacterium]|nr:DUF4249 domain-containing protein [Bacteroidia bacterium]
MIRKTKIRCKDSLHIVFSILAIFIFSGCQKVINVDLNDAAPLIVIEGLITDRVGPYTVTISKSGSYFNQPVLPPVSDAVVIITDNVGTTDTLKEKRPGIYLTSKTRGIPGRTYTLKVLSENKEYMGSSTMHSHVYIDSLSLRKSQTQHFGFGDDAEDKINVEIHCFFKDPGEKNFYRIKVFTNDTARTENYLLYDDQYVNGQETALRVAHARAGDTDRIELYSLDNQTYGYYRTLEDLLYTNPVFGSTPANPNTNLNNGALGYFGACAISSKTIIITNSLLNTVR